MAVIRWDFESGSNGNAITTTNTGAGVVQTSGGTGVISTAQAFTGTRSILLTATTTNGGIYVGQGSLGGVTSLGVDVCMWLSTAPSGNIPVLWIGTGSRMVSLEVNSARKLVLKDSPFTALWTSVDAIPASQWVRVSLFATQGSSTGTVRAAWFSDPTSSSTDSNKESTLLTGRNTGAAAYTDIRIGMKTASGTQTAVAYFDQAGYDTAATDLLPPPTLSSTVTAVDVEIVLAVPVPTIDAQAGVSGGGPVGITLAAVAPVVSGQRQATVVAVPAAVTLSAVAPAVLGQRNVSTAAVAASAAVAAVAPVVSGSATVAAVAAAVTVAAGVPAVSVGGNGAVTAVAPLVTVGAGVPVVAGQQHASIFAVATSAVLGVVAPTVTGQQHASVPAAVTGAVLTAVPPSFLVSMWILMTTRASAALTVVPPVVTGSASTSAAVAAITVSASTGAVVAAGTSIVVTRVLVLLSFGGSPIIRTVTPPTPRDRVWLVATRSRRFIVEGR